MWKTTFKKIEGVWSGLGRPYSFTFFRGSLPQILFAHCWILYLIFRKLLQSARPLPTIKRSSRPEVFSKKRVLKILLCQSIFFNKAADLSFIKKETLAQIFSCEFCEISKNNFSYRAPSVAKKSISKLQKVCYFFQSLW